MVEAFVERVEFTPDPFDFAQGRLSPRWKVRALPGMTYFYKWEEC